MRKDFLKVTGSLIAGTQLTPNPNHQQVRQMDNDAFAIKEDTIPIVPGEEGLRDIRTVRLSGNLLRKTGNRYSYK